MAWWIREYILECMDEYKDKYNDEYKNIGECMDKY